MLRVLNKIYNNPKFLLDKTNIIDIFKKANKNVMSSKQAFNLINQKPKSSKYSLFEK